jgi:hypothetical protein
VRIDVGGGEGGDRERGDLSEGFNLSFVFIFQTKFTREFSNSLRATRGLTAASNWFIKELKYQICFIF